MVKNQYQEWFFFYNSGNGFEKSDSENPYICILDLLRFHSKLLGWNQRKILIALGINGLSYPNAE